MAPIKKPQPSPDVLILDKSVKAKKSVVTPDILQDDNAEIDGKKPIIDGKNPILVKKGIIFKKADHPIIPSRSSLPPKTEETGETTYGSLEEAKKFLRARGFKDSDFVDLDAAREISFVQSLFIEDYLGRELYEFSRRTPTWAIPVNPDRPGIKLEDMVCGTYFRQTNVLIFNAFPSDLEQLVESTRQLSASLDLLLARLDPSATGSAPRKSSHVIATGYADFGKESVIRIGIMSHEMHHRFSWHRTRSLVKYGGENHKVAKWFSEGLTEFLSDLLLSSKGVPLLVMTYEPEVRVVDLLAQLVDLKTLRQAYFSGDFEGVLQSVDQKLGAGSFADLMKKSNPAEAQAYLERKFKAAGRSYILWGGVAGTLSPEIHGKEDQTWSN